MPQRTADATRRALLLPLPLLVALAAGPAAADEPNPYYLGASQTFTYIDNLYLLSDALQPLVTAAGNSVSDTVSSTMLIAGIDQTWGRQRIYGSGRLGTNRYANNSQLNNDSYALDLALDWATVERLSGKVKLGATQNLARFDVNTSGVNVTKKNVENVEMADASIQVGLVTKFSGEAAIGYRRVSYTAEEYNYREYRQDSASVGVRYRPSSALNVGAAYRFNRIEYPLFYVGTPDPVDREDRQYLDLTAFWHNSDVSQFYARISPTRITFQQYTQRDDDEITGALSWHWQPTGKLKLETTLSRDSGQGSGYDSNINQGGISSVGDYSSITSMLQLRADYEFSAKVSFNAGVRYAQRQIEDTVSYSEGAPVTTTGTDKTTYLSLGGRWTPTRNSLVGCDLLATDRRSNNPSLSVPYSNTTFGCYGQLTLQ